MFVVNPNIIGRGDGGVIPRPRRPQFAEGTDDIAVVSNVERHECTRVPHAYQLGILQVAGVEEVPIHAITTGAVAGEPSAPVDHEPPVFHFRDRPGG